jgi:hypothetical protein
MIFAGMGAIDNYRRQRGVSWQGFKKRADSAPDISLPPIIF